MLWQIKIPGTFLRASDSRKKHRILHQDNKLGKHNLWKEKKTGRNYRLLAAIYDYYSHGNQNKTSMFIQ